MGNGKRLVTNSMLATFRSCRWKYWYRYIEGLTPAKQRSAPNRGNLFHELMRGLYSEGEDFNHVDAIERWKAEQRENAQRHFDQTQATYGFIDEHILTAAQDESESIASEVAEIYGYYKENTYVHDCDEWKVLFCEQPFEVPIVDRADRRHMRWRFAGKWDIVVQHRKSGRVFIWDHKLTIREPMAFIASASLDTQPIAYTWAGKYLASVSGEVSSEAFNEARKTMPHGGAIALNIDGPAWPSGVEAPSGFALSVTRRKVPKKPTAIKSGKRLSKTMLKDTTPELVMEAILENGFDPEDYREDIDRLKKAGPRTYLREEVAVDMKNIERWMEETRLTCEEMLRVERFGTDRLYRTDPVICQNQYGKRCSYWSLCYGDYDVSLADFVKRAPNAELAEETNEDSDGVG